MLVVDVLKWKSAWSSEAKVICRFGWDDGQNKIVILRGKIVGRRILRQRYLDKRYYPQKLIYLDASQGKKFIEDLCRIGWNKGLGNVAT